MALSELLASAPGRYCGTGDGIESGPFLSRFQISRLPNGGALIDYEASSREHGLQHWEQTMLVAGPNGRHRLYIAHIESPYMTELVETAPGTGRFEQAAPSGPHDLAVVIQVPEVGRIIYAWWWALPGERLIERSRADAHLDVI